MLRNTQTLAILLILSLSVFANPQHSLSDKALTMSLSDIAFFVEGVIFGVVREQFNDLESCLTDAGTIQTDLVSALQNYESGTFDGYRKALQEVGEATALIPTLTKDCVNMTADLTNLVKMATIFEHPATLIYHVGKSLLLNGVEIYTDFTAAFTAYNQSDYFTCGKYIGEVLDVVFLQAPQVKRPVDENAYNFMNGFFIGIQMDIDEQNLYNNMTGLGSSIFGPIDATMKEFSSNNAMSTRVWMAVHDVSHIFQEGGAALIVNGVLTEDQLTEVRTISACLDQSKFSATNSNDVLTLFQRGYAYYNAGNMEALGHTFAEVATKLCEAEITFLA